MGNTMVKEKNQTVIYKTYTKN